jgi:hypothetical protein
MQIVKPDFHPFKKYAFVNVDESLYSKLAISYSVAKSKGIKGIYLWSSGVGVYGIVHDVLKGSIIQYGKRKVAALVINGAVYICSPAVLVFTNATKIILWTKRAHMASAYIFECLEDTTNLAFFPLDMILFGQPIPVGSENRYNLLANSSDFFR